MVGWGFEPHSRATLGFLFGCGPRAAAAVSRSGLAGAAGVVGSNSLALRYGIRPSQHLNSTTSADRREP